MAGNSWFHCTDGKRGSSIEDPDHTLLPVSGFEGQGQQLDPTHAAAESTGRSPRNILASNFGDELINSNNGGSKTIGVSAKDASAVGMSRHVGIA